MKKLLGGLLLALSAMALHAAADTSTLNVLHIDRTDGVRETLQLDPAMVVKFLPEEILIAHPKVLIAYKLEEIASFSYANAETSKTYDGDHESALEEVNAADRSVSITADEITIGGTEPIVIYDLRGIERVRANSDGTSATVSISTLPAGVYIVKSGNITLKVTI